MQGINLFISDKIRLHPIDFTADGLGMAGRPVILLDLDVSDDVLFRAIQEALAHSRTDVPPRPLTTEEERAYYRSMGIRSKRDLGIGVDIIFENGVYTLTQIDKKGVTIQHEKQRKI